MLDYCSYGFEINCGFSSFNQTVLLSAVLFPENNRGRTVIHLSYIFWGFFLFFLAFVVGCFCFFLFEICLLMNGRDLILLYALTLSGVESYS